MELGKAAELRSLSNSSSSWTYGFLILFFDCITISYCDCELFFLLNLVNYLLLFSFSPAGT